MMPISFAASPEVNRRNDFRADGGKMRMRCAWSFSESSRASDAIRSCMGTEASIIDLHSPTLSEHSYENRDATGKNRKWNKRDSASRCNIVLVNGF